MFLPAKTGLIVRVAGSVGTGCFPPSHVWLAGRIGGDADGVLVGFLGLWLG